MPLQRGEVQLGVNTIYARPFHWPAPPLRVGIHPTAAGRLIEVDTTTRLQDVDLEVVGDEEMGWAIMDDTMKVSIEGLFQAGLAFLVADWRGNSGMFFFLEAPEFTDLAAKGEDAPLETYWGFRFRLGRIS